MLIPQGNADEHNPSWSKIPAHPQLLRHRHSCVYQTKQDGDTIDSDHDKPRRQTLICSPIITTTTDLNPTQPNLSPPKSLNRKIQSLLPITPRNNHIPLRITTQAPRQTQHRRIKTLTAFHHKRILPVNTVVLEIIAVPSELGLTVEFATCVGAVVAERVRHCHLAAGGFIGDCGGSGAEGDGGGGRMGGCEAVELGWVVEGPWGLGGFRVVEDVVYAGCAEGEGAELGG